MPRHRLWDHLKMTSFLMIVTFTGIPGLAAQETPPQNSTTSLEDASPASLMLPRAAKEGNLVNVTELIAQGADVNVFDGAPITYASENGHFEVVKYLLEAGANPNASDENSLYYGQPLVLAAENNYLDIIDLLLDAGVTLKPDRYRTSALESAATNGYLPAVQKLIGAGADIHYRGDGALRFAAEKGHLDIVQALINAGAMIHDLAIDYAARKGHLEIVRTLTEGEVSAEDLGSALSHAASSGHLQVVKYLMQKGADPNYAEGALDGAARYGHLEVVRHLLESGANITCEGTESLCPWHHAARRGYPDVIALMAEYGADVNSALGADVIAFGGRTYVKGWTVMHLAAYNSQLIMQQLMDLGAQINAQDARGSTPLHIAVDGERLIVAKELLRFCADATLTDGDGKKALDIARDLALRNATEFSTYEVLSTTMQKAMSDEIASTPQNRVGVVGLVKEFLAIVEANSTLKEQLKDYMTHPSFVEQAILQLFEERARKGMVKIFEDHTCNVSLQEEGTIAVGTEYLTRCSCIPGQGPYLNITLKQEDKVSAPVSPVKAEGHSKLP